MRLRWLRLLTPLAITALVAACGSAPARTNVASPSYVPWLALPAAHQYLEAPLASPVPPIPVPAGTPECQAAQLEGVSLGMSGAAGNVNMPLQLRNRSGSGCFLRGYPDATVLGASGQTLAHGSGAAGQGTYFNDGPVVSVMMPAGTPNLPPPGPGSTAPQGQAFMNFSWYDCHPSTASKLELDLPDGGGRLYVPFAMHAYYSGACDGSPSTAPAVLRGPFSPTGVEWPPGYDYIDVSVSLSGPESVHRGTTLVYFVTIKNVSAKDYVLTPCADYNEFLGPKQIVATYQLNCTPPGHIAPGSDVTFEMHLDIPATFTAGTNQILWALMDGRTSPSLVKATIDIT